MNEIPVAWRDRPFDGMFHRSLIPLDDAPTMAGVLERVPGLPDVFRAVCEVRLNGELVPRDRWERVRPKPSLNSCITLHMPMRDGGGQKGAGAKNPTATIATIAVLLAAAAVTGGAAAGLGPALGLGATAFAGGSLGASAPLGGLAVFS